ncbi:MAG: type I secretion C-terminal target domain-containing protein, partial [Halioglobus sp.]|nr:type I secretion C-terminal target domain-containing protein [Halioglobus sp.]
AELVGGNTASAQGFITDPDLPAISIDSVSALEGQPLVFTISLDQPAATPVSVSWATALDIGAVDPAELADFVSAAGTVTFAPGQSTQTVSIDTVSDLLNEANETLRVVLSSPVNAVIGSGTGIGTIIDDDGPSGGVHTATVDEDGLPAGIGDDADGDWADSNLDLDSDESTFSGVLSANVGEQGPASFSLAGMQGQTAMLGAEQVMFSWDGGSSTLTATTASGERIGTDIFEVSLNASTGAYGVRLLANALHTVAGTEDDVAAALTYTVTDSVGATGSGTLNVVIDDDLPEAIDTDTTVTRPDINLVVVLDVSGSMNNLTSIPADGGGFLTRLEVAIESINRLFDAYDARGNVAVRMVTFASGAGTVGDVWTDTATARAQLTGITAGGLTNITAALETVSGIDALDGGADWGDGIWNDPGRITSPGVDNVSYFASDGRPTAGSNLNGAREGFWEDFVNDNEILSFALGMGNDASSRVLDRIAFDGRNGGTDTDSIIVNDFAQLSETIVGTVPPLSGNLIFNNGAGGGADGVELLAVTIEGTTFTYNLMTDAFAVDGDLDHSFDAGDNVLRVTSSKNGAWEIDMDSGVFVYQADATASGTDGLAFALTDADGDSVDSAVQIDLDSGFAVQSAVAGPEAPAPLLATAGDDIFAFELAEAGSPGLAQHDTIVQFGAQGTDVLDVSDLLVDATPGEGDDIGDLDRFLNVTSNGSDSVLRISSDGGFTDGVFDPGAVDQTITLVGVDLGSDSAQAIRDMLSSGQLQAE